MIRQLNKNILFNDQQNVGKALAEIYCLDADVANLPLNVATGSMALTVDGGKLYLFDEAAGNWALIKTIKE